MQLFLYPSVYLPAGLAGLPSSFINLTVSVDRAAVVNIPWDTINQSINQSINQCVLSIFPGIDFIID